jgi:hypothetical protein
MKGNGLVTPYLIFVRGMVFPGRHTRSGRADTSKKESKDYVITANITADINFSKTTLQPSRISSMT